MIAGRAVAVGWSILLCFLILPPGADALSPLGQTVLDWLQRRRGEVPFSLDPGIAIAIVSDHGERTDLMGLGEQGMPAQRTVTADTLFEIGSISKTMVALGLAVLVDRGALRWDDTLVDIMGPRFGFGPEPYVRSHLTVRDLLAHRSGLGEGQGDFFTALFPSDGLADHLANITPARGFRSEFQYSNTGWDLAGEVLKTAANATSWCAALHKFLFTPLGMAHTFCDRNEIPDEAEPNVAGVFKVSPCDGLEEPAAAFRRPPTRAPRMRPYSMVRTGATGSFSWGAAEAAGSILSSASDLAQLMRLLLTARSVDVGSPSSPLVVTPRTLAEMMSAQQLVPRDWVRDLGWPPALPGEAIAAGLGFDLVGQVPVRGLPGTRAMDYAEKNGDTDMHKARLGLLLDAGVGVALLSNLGGEIGDQLTALKFGVLALATGASSEDADEAVEQALRGTRYWQEHFVPYTTCTPCGTVLLSAGPCQPANRSTPLRPLADFAGTYGDALYGAALQVLVASDGSALRLRLGPLDAPLLFSKHSRLIRADCPNIAELLQLPAWLGGELLSASGVCEATEFRVAPEVPEAGISVKASTIAFPWGCGAFPLPDGLPVLLVLSERGASWALLPTAQVLFHRLQRGGGRQSGGDMSSLFL